MRRLNPGMRRLNLDLLDCYVKVGGITLTLVHRASSLGREPRFGDSLSPHSACCRESVTALTLTP